MTYHMVMTGFFVGLFAISVINYCREEYSWAYYFLIIGSATMVGFNVAQAIGG